MKHEDASILLEDVLDTLVEVGNGTTDEMLHEAADKLFRFRDEWFKKQNEAHSTTRKVIVAAEDIFQGRGP